MTVVVVVCFVAVDDIAVLFLVVVVGINVVVVALLVVSDQIIFGRGQ